MKRQTRKLICFLSNSSQISFTSPSISQLSRQCMGKELSIIFNTNEMEAQLDDIPFQFISFYNTNW